MKKYFYSVFSLILVVQVFLGTAGVLVFEHHCKKDGTSRSFFVANVHERDVTPEVESCKKSACCSAKEVTTDRYPTLTEETCCSNSTAYLQMDTDLAINSTDVSLILTSIPTNVVTIPNNLILSICSASDYRGPPPLSTTQRLSVFQSYLI